MLVGLRVSALALALACMSLSAHAQGQRGGGDRGGPGMGGGFGGPAAAMRGGSDTTSRLSSKPGEPQGGLQLGPTGRWWDNKAFAQTIGLNSGQQQRMDTIFSANRDNLATLLKNMQHEESQLRKLTRARELDENQIFQQIDRVTAARADAEKAYAHMMLMIRKEMTPEQTARLDDYTQAAAQ